MDTLDLTAEWEKECNKRNSPKIKFPLKMFGDDIEFFDLVFIDPTLDEPKLKKKENNDELLKIIDLSKKKKKKNNIF
jgi:hypothetical protein